MKLRRIDEVGRLALVACRLAAEDARLPTGTDEVGVVLGSATAGLHSTVAHLRSLVTAGPAGVPALGFSNMIGNAAASLCALEFGWRGPNLTIAQKQASALSAIAFAVDLLEQGRVSAFLCGGVDDIEEMFFRVHDRFRVLSPTDGGQEASRPFHAAPQRLRAGHRRPRGGPRDRLFGGPPRRDAARGDPRRRRLLVGLPAERLAGRAQPACVRAMLDALSRAGLAPADVDVVFASANGVASARPGRGARARAGVRPVRRAGGLDQGRHRRVRRRRGPPR